MRFFGLGDAVNNPASQANRPVPFFLLRLGAGVVGVRVATDPAPESVERETSDKDQPEQ